MRAAAAQVAVQVFDDLGPAGSGMLLQQGIGREDHARGAVAALEGVVVPERLLHRIQDALPGQPFDGEDGPSRNRAQGSRAGRHRFPVHQDRAGPAHPGPTAHLGAGQAKFVAQDPDQHPGPVAGNPHPLTVQGE
jgi:hypothetical protein